jgi:hypothetical protein
MTADPQAVTRFVLIPDASGEALAPLVDPYAPDLFFLAAGSAGEPFGVPGVAAPMAQLEGHDLRANAERIAAEHPGQTIGLVADAAELRSLVCHALGVPPEAAERFLIVPNAISVLEVDVALRWAVVRLNEGRPLPGDR